MILNSFFWQYYISSLNYCALIFICLAAQRQLQYTFKITIHLYACVISIERIYTWFYYFMVFYGGWSRRPEILLWRALSERSELLMNFAEVYILPFLFYLLVAAFFVTAIATGWICFQWVHPNDPVYRFSSGYISYLQKKNKSKKTLGYYHNPDPLK